jgi:hypothetical protein
MKKAYSLLPLIALSILLIAPESHARKKVPLSIGMRQHVDHSEFDDYPYTDDTLSYSLAYEYREGQGLWQIAVNYSDNIDVEDGEPEIDQIITPALNLLFIDGEWIGGTGILSSYVETEGETDWTDLYWQLMLGFAIPIGKLDVTLMGFYPFENWGSVLDFGFSDVELGGWVNFKF